MGAWGFFDDENDKVHDLWYDLYNQIKKYDIESDVDKITDKVYNYILSEKIEYSDAIGIFLLSMKYIAGEDLVNGFGNRIFEIVEKANNKTNNKIKMSMAVYEIQHPEKVNKKLLKLVLKYIKYLSDPELINNEGWVKPDERIEALECEKKYVKKMLEASK